MRRHARRESLGAMRRAGRSRPARRVVHPARMHAEQSVDRDERCRWQDARDARALGVDVQGIEVDMPFVARRKRGLVKEFADYRIDGIAQFPLYAGEARFLSPTRAGRRRRRGARSSALRHRDRQHGSARALRRLDGDRFHRQRRGARSRTDPRIGDRLRRRLHRVRARAVFVADGRPDDDSDSQRSFAYRK